MVRLKLSGFLWTLATLGSQLVVLDQEKRLPQMLLGCERSFWFAFRNLAVIYPETGTLFKLSSAWMRPVLDFELSDLVSDSGTHLSQSLLS